MSIVELLPNNGVTVNSLNFASSSGGGIVRGFAYNSATSNNNNIPQWAFNGYVLVIGKYAIYYFDGPVVSWNGTVGASFSIPFSSDASPSNGVLNASTAFGHCSIECNNGTSVAAVMNSTGPVGSNYITCVFTKPAGATGGTVHGSFVVNLN